jgi:Ni,Fe-hydrogenase III large subunit
MLITEEWRAMAAALAGPDAPELLALWADPARVYALLHDTAAPAPDSAWFLASVAVENGGYPALSPHCPASAWFERMIADLWGHAAEGAVDARPWLDHGTWPVTAPLSLRPRPRATSPEPKDFLPVDAEDYHQIALGPVHAGIAEPGHFRLSAQGETVLRLEVRLGWVHKGTLALMRGKSPRAAARFAARLSGDTTVAHSVAFARAAEAASETDAPPRATALRAVMTELERVANHLGDCGAIAGATIPFLAARFGLHREAVLRASAVAFGHRLMMDAVVPGGVAADLTPGGAEAILRALGAVDEDVPERARVFDGISPALERMVGTGVVAPSLARAFAAGGPVGRASGRAFDVRRTPGYAPYDRLEVGVPVLAEGDVDARLRIRLAELKESSRLVRALLADLPEGAVSVPLPQASGEGIGWAEGCRGDIWHWLRLEGGQIAALFMRDPGWLQWPLLEAATAGGTVDDFPLSLASFNASASGVDL